MKRLWLVFVAGSLLAQRAPSEAELRVMLLGRLTPKVEISARTQVLRIFDTRSDWIAAAEQLEHLRALAPEEPEYAYQLGLVYQRIAKGSFDRMRAAAPQSARVQQMYGEQYSIAREMDKAIRAYQAAIAADPKLEGSHAALAILYLQSGKRAEAKAEIERELAIAPESAAAKQLAQAVESAGR